MKSKLTSTTKSALFWIVNVILVTVFAPYSSSAAAVSGAGDRAPIQDGGSSGANSTPEKPDDENLFLAEASERVTPHRMFSLRACFDQADRENKEILVSASSLPIAQAGIIIAKAIPNPTFNMIYGFGNSFNYIIAGNGQQIQWMEEIQVAGKRSKKSAVAHANYFQMALQLEAKRFDVHNRVRRAYAELAAAHAYGDVIEAQREIAVRLQDISQKRFDAGKAPGSEVLQAKLGVMQFDTQRNQAWGRIVQDSAQMNMLLGISSTLQEIIDVQGNGLFKLSAQKTDLIPDPDRGAPPLQQLLPVAWRERNDLKAAIQTAYARKQALTLAKTQRIPDPAVGFMYTYSTYKPFQFGFFDPAGVLPFLQPIFPLVNLTPSFTNPNPAPSLVENLYHESIASGAALQQSEATGTPIPNINQDKVPFQAGYQLIVQQESPIFYQYQGQISQAKATWFQQLKQNDQLRAQIATDIVTAYESVLVTRANIKKFHEQILPAASRVSQMAFRGYQLGKMNLATAMLAQQQYQQLLSSYFDAVVAYQNAWADLEKAVGVPLKL
jgi:outer membrane protein TolC